MKCNYCDDDVDSCTHCQSSFENGNTVWCGSAIGCDDGRSEHECTGCHWRFARGKIIG